MAVPAASQHAIRILLAEDDAGVRRLMARKLRTAGFSVKEAKSGPEALKLLRDTHFRLLVLELDLPRIDGFAILKTVRCEFPHLQVLAISDADHRALLEASKWFGARIGLT